MTLNEQLDIAIGLVLSRYHIGVSDEELPKLFNLIHEVCPDAHPYILVLAAAIQDARFDEYGLADAGQVLRTLKLTGNFRQDVESFLGLLKVADESALLEAQAEAAIRPDDEFRATAREFFDRFGLNASHSDLVTFLAER